MVYDCRVSNNEVLWSDRSATPAARPRLVLLGPLVDWMLAAIDFGINVFVPSDGPSKRTMDSPTRRRRRGSYS
jgi:hypothetical protein